MTNIILVSYSILNFYKRLLLTKKIYRVGMKAIDWIGWKIVKWLVS